MSTNEESQEEKMHRFERAFSELIDEGFPITLLDALLEAAAERAGVHLQDVCPSRH